MRRVVVKGEPYHAVPLKEGDVRPGVLVAGTLNRRAMRVVCLDGPDVILRNLRFPAVLEAEPLEKMPEYYDRIEREERKDAV